MRIPFVAAAGLTVIVGAKLLSWLYNVNTAQEREQEYEEKKRQEEIYACADSARKQQKAKQLKILQQMGEEHSQFLLKSVHERRLAVANLPDELNKLEYMIWQEVADKTSSPYRRSALRREYARIEDAAVRMREYQNYLNRQEKEIKSLLEEENFKKLLKLEAAESLLPAEWLYPGKLVLVSKDELGRPLPPFNHRISFGNNDLIQKTLALHYGDEIPILITSVNRNYKNLFYGCVARGALYYHHIMQNQPVEFLVKNSSRDSYIGDLYEFVQAYLPFNQLKDTRLRLLPGQKVSVYLTAYDLCLGRNPFDRKRRAIEVSEFDYQTRNAQNYQQIYLSIDENLLDSISDMNFYNTEEPWTLLDYTTTNGMISLAKASVRVACIVRDEKILEVQNVTQTSMLQVGLDTPFRFTLIVQSLAQTEQIGWKYGIQEFLRFCSQSALDMSSSPERVAQSCFYQRWEKVIAYQRNREENFSLEFPVEAADVEKDSIILHRDRLPLEEKEQFDLVLGKMSEVLSEHNTLNPTRCICLQQWDVKRNDYVPALRFNRRKDPLYYQQKNIVTVEGPVALLDDTQMLRLVVNIPSASLKRQSQALDDFFQDRLVNPSLKNILLAPEHYLPEQDDGIVLREGCGVLDDSQKRVVDLALNEHNIALIQGPPGAGKTTAIVEILYQIFHRQPKSHVLVVSQQNTAVDNALSKFLTKNSGDLKHGIQAIRIGNLDKISSDISPLAFDHQYKNFLAELDARAVKSVVSLPENESDLCHVWRANLKQAMQSGAKGQEEFFITLLADRNLVGSTCVGLATNKAGIDQLQFDIAIIDEAGRATLPEIIIPILRSRKVILVGDHYQLPPSIAPLLRDDNAIETLSFLREDFFGNSFFEIMFEHLPIECRETLNKQYRMAPAIGDLVASLFYSPGGNRMLFNGYQDSFFEKSYLLDKSIYWVDVKGKQQRPQNSTSWENIHEAKEIANFLSKLSKKIDRSVSIAIITPYSAQKESIRRQLKKIGWYDNQLGRLSIKVNTVDAFQGSEADVVCYSTVRTKGSLNFILDRKRLNVACSRAKLHLLFFGDNEYLTKYRDTEKHNYNLFSQIMNFACDEKVTFRNFV